jgi:hypothetical protein
LNVQRFPFDVYETAGVAVYETGVAVTVKLAVASSVVQTTLSTLLTNVRDETLSVPVQESFAGSRVIVEPRIPEGITTLNLVPSYAKDPVELLVVAKLADFV